MLNSIVNINTYTSATADAYGQQIQTLAKSEKRWAEIKRVSGNMNNGSLNSRFDFDITVKVREYRSNPVLLTNTVVFEGGEYKIVNIHSGHEKYQNNAEAYKFFQYLDCKRMNDGASNY